MPWLERCIELLPREMPKDSAIKILTFLSCVGLIQNVEKIEPLDVDEQEEIVEQVVERIELTSVPASSNSRWADLEISYIDLSPDLSHSDVYVAYVKRCTSNSVSVRTLTSFKCKRQRLMHVV
ncbi:unnamed protein product [Leuciscus chuanchicus]